jgi:hypothetical protein
MSDFIAFLFSPSKPFVDIANKCNKLKCNYGNNFSVSSESVTAFTMNSGLRGRSRPYLTILELADHALFKMVRYVLLRPLRLELFTCQS